MAPLPRRFRRDRSGSVAVTTVMALGVTFGMAAITVDASRFYLVKRRQQGTTDLAAVAAAANIADARAAAAASLAANGVPAGTLASVEVGTYAADPAVAAPQRFTAGGTAPNAARVTLRSAPSAVFGALLGTAVATVGTRATAVNANVAGFALGSTLARVDAGLANAVLGGLTRSTLTLSAADYAGLAAARVDLFGVANALAARVGATGSYGSLAARSVRVADVAGAAADALSAAGTSPSAVAALRAVATAVGSSGPSLVFGSLVSFDAFGTLAVGSPPPAAAALPLLPLVAAAARLGGGAVDLSANLGGSGTAIAAATVRIAVAGPATGSSYAAVGPVGTTLHTARTRVLLTLQLAQSGTASGLNLPLYVEVAPATAALSALGCSAGAPVDPAATLSVTPGAVDGWIGNVSDAMLVDMTAAPSPSAAVLTNLVVASVWGRAHATVSNTGATAVPFARADIADGTAKTTSTTDVTSSLLSRLFGDLQLGATVLGAPVQLPAGTAAAIGALLQADLQPIDVELSNTLAALGLTIGDATTWVRATRCGQGVVVD